MRVGEQQGEVKRAFGKFLEQGLAKQAQAGAGIQNHDLPGMPHLNAGSVAPVTDGGGARRGNRAPHAPEFYARSEFDALI